MTLQHISCSRNGNYAAFQKYTTLPYPLQGNPNVVDHAETCSVPYKARFSDGAEGDAFPYIQTLREFPKEELLGKVVMVRFDSDILLPEKNDKGASSFTSALLTIKYLHESGAKVLLVSSWSVKINSKLLAAESVAKFLSSVLQLKVVPVKSVSGYVQSKMEEIDKSNILLLLENLSQFKEERANCSKFAEHLSAGVDIFVNDVFSQCHKILASNVGVTCFCCACVAGFHFEEDLYKLKKAFRTDKKPYVAVIGGGNFLDKAAALHFLASRCDCLIFVGNMAFQIMHALGLRVPAKFVEHGALEEALRLIQFAKSRNMPILFSKDFWCINDQLQNQLEIFPSDSILDVKFGFANHESGRASELAQILDKLTQRNCCITVVGNVTSKAVIKESSSVSVFNVVKNAAVMWEFLKRRKLPGLMALDRLPKEEKLATVAVARRRRRRSRHRRWSSSDAVADPQVVVEESILWRRVLDSRFGCDQFGGMRRPWRGCYGVGLWRSISYGWTYSTKLARDREVCVADYVPWAVGGLEPKAYPFEIDWHGAYTDPAQPLVVDIGSESSLKCPNPDFSKPEHRWRMVQKSLIEGIGDLLASDGKVFLQSDIESVALRMKEQFIEHGKGKLAVVQDRKDTAVGREEWLKENPFGVQSDWEQHLHSSRRLLEGESLQLHFLANGIGLFTYRNPKRCGALILLVPLENLEALTSFTIVFS
ncbi:hypothetical protein RJ639_020666 [Escallonia herrerae]|uniref:Phosphoglycerate kinase n=1 Tax=Escallonia herrerae TaxID=1293975 RepID=A0AA88V706_9ASTE|nr:hypothetical protein RJ639_020666 [Escallonia herrerae]